ncbi:hypothetical protein BDP55DRAFT_633851 [Colletotrichum godetiae]|uniref:F-box domain-containing protein n=1 Tax=Colletotrichum godetiae TaxID=1209918 RepID=A0AAJ0AGP4_9PEZI|nr:uncharacterized protein BDP55DRAFT_633851 [Colletotrichum godetiae]KAK1673571.1 hypothetical protein BDP55DRAFT_633851 [Colletotrichum godetiae]
MDIPEGHNTFNERVITFQSQETIANSVSPGFYTGYHDRPGREMRQRRNERHCRLYKVPREILFEIVHQLEPTEVFQLRHVSQLFLRLTSVKDFKNLFQITSLQKLEQLMQGVLGDPNIPPRFSSPFLFWVAFDERAKIREWRRRELLCQT